MTAELQTTQKSLYETDYVRWVEMTLARLKARDYAQVDWEPLLEEIEDMSRRERHSLESNLIVILLHLLKWQYQPELRSGSWKSSIREHRRRVGRSLQDSPSLNSYLQSVLASCYRNACAQAADETGFPLSRFPADCPYSAEAILDPDFLPD